MTRFSTKGLRFALSVAVVGLTSIAYSQAETAQTPSVSATPAPSVAAPASTFTFAPSIWLGARTNLVGNFANKDKDANTFGPFIKPGFTIKYSNSPLSVMAKYTFETSAAKGFGESAAFANAGYSKSVANNTYFQHEPIVLLSGQASEDWKINTFFDWWINTENKRAQNTFYELTVQPDVEYKVSSTFSVAVGYQLFRKNYFDSTVVGDASAGPTASTAKPAPGSYKASSADVVGQSPVTTLHAGIITANWKLGDKTNLVSFFRAGRQSSTIAGRTGINYRWNTDLSTALTEKTSLQLRYRLHIEDNNNADAYYYNRGRVIASYAFNKSWSADVQNTFTVEQTKSDTSRAKYTNENYAGVTYKF